jgi:hypothetical protein
LHRRVLQGALAHLAGQGKDIGVHPWQLLDGEQRRRQCQTRIGGQHVGVQMGADGTEQVAGDGAGGDGKAGPGQYRQHQQLHVVVLAVVLQGGRFTASLDGFDQDVIGVQVGLEQVIQGGIEQALMAGAQQLVEQGVKGLQPGALFEPAGGLRDGLREGHQVLAVGRKLGGGTFGGTTHGGNQ